MASPDISTMKDLVIDQELFRSLWYDEGDERKHASFQASVTGRQKVSICRTDGKIMYDNDMQCAQCSERGQTVECTGSGKSGCLPCTKSGIDVCTHTTAFRIWNVMSVLELSTSEVGYMVEKFIARGEASSDGGQSDEGEENETSEGYRSSGTEMGEGEPGEKPMGIDVDEQEMLRKMRGTLEKRDKEIESLSQQLQNWGSLDELRERLEETKGKLGWDKIKKLEKLLKEREKEIEGSKAQLADYRHFFDILKEQGLTRLKASEKAITTLDEFIEYAHPDRPAFEDDEIKVIRGRLASLWETDRTQVAAWLLDHSLHPILSPNHKLGEGCSEYIWTSN